MNEITNDKGITIKLGQIWFMSSPASDRWPKTFPESSWLFMVTYINPGMIGGPHVNWKRKGKNYVSRTLDEFGYRYASSDNLFHGLRMASDEEVTYYLKRRPEYKTYWEEHQQ